MHEHGIRFQFRGLYAERGGLHSELTILKLYGTDWKRVYWADLNLVAQRSKSTLATLMARRVNTFPDWETMIELLCQQTADEFRKPNEATWIGATEPPEVEYRLHPFAPMGEPSMIYGEGGSGKSYLALTMCIAITFGINIAGMVPKKGRVMYLDYETSQNVMERRIRMLARSLGLSLDDPMILYYRGTQALQKDAQSIRANIINHQIDHLVIDSASLAVGGKLEDTEAVGAFFAALRSIGISSTLISHVAKNVHRDSATPFGSAYWRNFTRSEWQVIGSQEEGSSSLSMLVKHTKVNDEGKHPRLGYTFSFSEGMVRVTTTDPNHLPGLEEQASVPAQIADAILRRGGTATIQEIAQYLEMKSKAVETAISRNRNLFIQTGKSGKAFLYAVAANSFMKEDEGEG